MGICRLEELPDLYESISERFPMTYTRRRELYALSETATVHDKP